MKTMCKQSGFTLIELSIVLVVIGLIVGGVLVGQDLIWSAQNRKVVSLMQSYESAYHTFRLKYNCLPGDCKNGNSFWSGVANGNGDKQITWSTLESHNASESLFEAGLRPDDRSASGWGYQEFFLTKGVGHNTVVYMSPTPSTNWTVWSPAGGNTAPGRSGNALISWATSQDTFGRLATISSDRMYAIDNAIDDGSPKTGKVQALNGNIDFAQTTLGQCSDNGNNVYLFTDTEPNCQMIYFLD